MVRYSLGLGDRRDESEAGIQFLGLLQFPQERSFLDPPDRIKKGDRMCAPNFFGMPDHAPKGRDADAARHEYGGTRDVSVKNQIAIRAFQ